MSSITELVATSTRAAMGTVPPQVDRIARLHLLDSLAVGALAAVAGPSRGVTRLPDDAGTTGGTATTLGTGAAAAPAVAALVNGTLIHSLEYDDTHVASVMHGSATLTPAAMAVGQHVGAPGSRVVDAYVMGWELLVRLGLASPGTLQARGFQTTSAAGPFGAALVSALLHEDASHDVDALGVAGSQPGGTFAFLADGDLVKAAQPAWAAHSGILAHQLARAGITGPRDVLEGPFGFHRLYAGDDGAADRLRSEVADLGTRWHLADAAFKLVPCCHFIHPYLEALQQLVDRGLRVEDLRTLHCHVPTGALAIIAEPWDERRLPRTGHDARWSLPYVLAAHLVDGEVGVGLFEEPVGGRRADVAARITHEEWSDSGFPAVFPARLTATTHDGSTLTAEVADVLGGAGRPVGDQMVLDKAVRNLSAAGLDARRVDVVVGSVVEQHDFDPASVMAALTRA